MKDTVKDYMATRLITFRPEDSIIDAITTILKHSISGAPVVNRHGELVGMLSESDCIKTIVDGPYNNLPSRGGSVNDYMSTKLVTITPDKSIHELAYKFTKSPFRRFPVIENGQLVGQISRSDVLKAIRKMSKKIKHVPSSWKTRIPTK
jgi:predicted transcriptional regulator